MDDYSGQPHHASTTWEWRKAKIRRPAGGQGRGAEGASSPGEGGSADRPARRRVALRWRHLSPFDRRRNLTVTLRYRGGAEGWIEVQARGSFGRFHGATALLDVWREVVDGATYEAYHQDGSSGVL